MKGDYLSYRRATGVSLLGLVIQAAQTLVLLAYAVLNRDSAATSAAIVVAVGIPIWLTLAILFDQHRRERVEALEAEALSASPSASSSVFESGGDEFRSAARRLAGLYKVFVPVVSLLLGAVLTGVGIWRFMGAREAGQALAGGALATPGGWAIGIGLAVGVVGFVFARYASGMAKQAVWNNLRAGAAYAALSSMVGVAIAIAHFVDIAGPDVIRRLLPIAIPAVMVLLGAEVFLNFLLDLYRPRKPGETPRPAFDSRVLGFVAAPDRIAQSVSDAINYQLGFDVTSSWFYQLLTRRVWLLLVSGFAVVWVLSCFVVLRPDQRGIVLRFGEFVREVGPGLSVKAPWPIDHVEIPEYVVKDAKGKVISSTETATGLRQINAGTPPPTTDGPILWTNDHVGEEIYQIVKPSRTRLTVTANMPVRPEGPGTNTGSAGSIAMVAVEIPLLYSVTDVKAFDELAPSGMRDELLLSVAKRQVVQYMTRQSVDDILGPKRDTMAAELKSAIQNAFDELGRSVTGRSSGVEIVSLGVTSAHPNKEVARNFERVVQADQLRQAAILAARKDEIQTLAEVVGSVDLARQIAEQIRKLEEMRDQKAGEADLKAQELAVQKLLERAGGRASALIAEASADRWTRHMSERGRAARYQGQLASYMAAPMIYKASEYFAALSESVKTARLYIVSDRVKDLHARMELQDKDTGAEVFQEKKTDE